MEITGAMIWGAGVSVFLLFMGNAIRVKSAESTEEKKRASILADRLLIVETKMVEEARVREIINECVKDIKEGQVEIRSDIKGLTGEIHDLAQLMANHNING